MRLTIRRLMILVAITAVALATWEYLVPLVDPRWAGAVPFWGTLVLSTTTAAAWVVRSRRKNPNRS